MDDVPKDRPVPTDAPKDLPPSAIPSSTLETSTLETDGLSGAERFEAWRAMRDFVEANLHSATLGPDLLCANFRCSRTYLYRMFRNEGGLMRYIQTRRLARVYRELTTATAIPPTLTELAYTWGFAGHSHLSRRFRAQFGMTPTEAGDLGRQQAAPGTERETGSLGCPIPRYRDWLQQLSDH